MPETSPQDVFPRVTVIGTGLIGCCVASLLKGHSVAEEVVGVDRQAAHLEMAQRLGFIDRGLTDPARGVMGAAAVILAVPLDEVFKVMDTIGPDVRPGAVITCTAGSTARLRTQMVRHLRAAENFVPAFPLVHLPGTGPGGASPGLLARQRCLVAAGEPIPDKAAAGAKALWTGIGMEVVALDSDGFEAAVAGHYYWPQAVALAARRVTGRGSWPEGRSSLTAWLEQSRPLEQLGRCHQLYAARLSALLDELVDEIHDLQRGLGTSLGLGTQPERGEPPAEGST